MGVYMEKKYTAKNLINNSRWVRFILHVPIREIEQLCVRLEEIIRENSELAVLENFVFFSNAATALVLFEMYRNRGFSFVEAYYKVAGPMWEYCEGEAYKYYKKSRSKRTFEKISKNLAGKIQKDYSGQWDMEILHADEHHIGLKCTKCFYASFFKRYGIEDVGAMFCYADEIIYGSMKNIDFSISGMLISEEEFCTIELVKR